MYEDQVNCMKFTNQDSIVILGNGEEYINVFMLNGFEILLKNQFMERIKDNRVARDNKRELLEIIKLAENNPFLFQNKYITKFKVTTEEKDEIKALKRQQKEEVDDSQEVQIYYQQTEVNECIDYNEIDEEQDKVEDNIKDTIQKQETKIDIKDDIKINQEQNKLEQQEQQEKQVQIKEEQLQIQNQIQKQQQQQYTKNTQFNQKQQISQVDSKIQRNQELQTAQTQQPQQNEQTQQSIQSLKNNERIKLKIALLEQQIQLEKSKVELEKYQMIHNNRKFVDKENCENFFSIKLDQMQTILNKVNQNNQEQIKCLNKNQKQFKEEIKSDVKNICDSVHELKQNMMKLTEYVTLNFTNMTHLINDSSSKVQKVEKQLICNFKQEVQEQIEVYKEYSQQINIQFDQINQAMQKLQAQQQTNQANMKKKLQTVRKTIKDNQTEINEKVEILQQDTNDLLMKQSTYKPLYNRLQTKQSYLQKCSIVANKKISSMELKLFRYAKKLQSYFKNQSHRKRKYDSNDNQADINWLFKDETNTRPHPKYGVVKSIWNTGLNYSNRISDIIQKPQNQSIQ